FWLYRFSVIPGFIKKPLKAYSSYKSCQIFFKITRDDLQTKPHKTYSYNFDPHNRLSGTATQIQQKSRQTRSEVISKQIFEILTWASVVQEVEKSFSHLIRRLLVRFPVEA